MSEHDSHSTNKEKTVPTELKVWEDVTVPEGKWQQVARGHGLSALQIRALDTRHNMPHIVEGREALAIRFLIPERVGTTLNTHWLNIYLDREKIITFHPEGVEAIEILKDRVSIHEILNQTPSGVLSLVADFITEQFTPIIDYVDDATDKLVDIVTIRPSEKQLHEMFHHKRLLSDMRRIALPTMMVLDGLQNGRYALIDKEYASTYLRDSYTYAWRVHELIDTVRDVLTSALDVYLSVVSNRLNEVMRRLTMVATTFMPISFLVGFGGMNFTKQIPFDSNIAFAILMALIVTLPVLMLLYFKRKGWI